MRIESRSRRFLIAPIVIATLLAGAALGRVSDQCGPFMDVSAAICPYVLEMYYLGITAGTSATTFSPDATVTRGQAAVFVSKSLNQTLARSSRRAALRQWWYGSYFNWLSGLSTTTLPDTVLAPVASDGTDVWVGGTSGVYRVRASDGKLLDTWTPGTGSILPAMGRVFITGSSSTPGNGALLMIDPSLPGAAAEVASVPSYPSSLAFDGSVFWTANQKSASVSMVAPGPTTPWSVTTVTAGFQAPSDVVFDGQNVWVTDLGACAILRLDAYGAVTQTVPIGSPQCTIGRPVFDGANLLVPVGDALEVVRASDGALAATIPIATGADRVAFDGERILVEKHNGGQNAPRGLTLLRASDFSVLRTEAFSGIGGPSVNGMAAAGVNFWLTFNPGGQTVLARY